MSGERPARGRGARSNPAGRFERFTHAPLEDDVWWAQDEEPGAVPTTVTPDASRSILTRNDSPDVPFSLSVNPYRGCEHGCAYCFARPSHAYLGLSAGLDFETRLLAKHDAAKLLREELSRPGYRPEPIALAPNTDAYQPVERRLGITRAVLEVLAETRHPVTVITKSTLVLRDLDLLVPMAREGLCEVLLSITTLDAELARRMEPRAPAPERRLRTARALAAAGVPVGVLASPMIPALNDHELERILEAAAAAGARSASYTVVRLPHELHDLFPEWLRAAYPSRAAKVERLLRDLRGGALNDSSFDTRMRGTGPFAELLSRRFAIACRRLGLPVEARELTTARFRHPTRGGQRRLFEDPP